MKQHQLLELAWGPRTSSVGQPQLAWMLGACLLLGACGKGGSGSSSAVHQAEATGTVVKIDKGVDLQNKVVRIGALNDESGQAATIGKPHALGKRILMARVNAGGSGLLPSGWKVELVEKDHGYDPQKSVHAYDQIKGEVLMIATSFGTPNTLPLLERLKGDNLIALPVSPASVMAQHAHTPPGAPSFVMEAMRGMDFVVDGAKKGGKNTDAIKAGIVYQNDHYGRDGLTGWRRAAAHHGVEIVSEHTVTPEQRDYAAIVTALRAAGATHVMLSVHPSASGPILGTASQLQYEPAWVGQSPTWVDRFFEPEVIPATVFANYYIVGSKPYWGEELPGMKEFLEAYEEYGRSEMKPDRYILASYLQGMTALEIVKRAIEAGDITREGVLKALQSMENYRAGGMAQPITLSTFPYVSASETRVLAPDFGGKTWKVMAPYAAPQRPDHDAAAAAVRTTGTPPR